MQLSSLLAETKQITVPFPEKEGFEVQITYLSKESLRKIGDKAKTIVFDQKTHAPIEGLDDELFTKLYVNKALTGWKGLKYEYLTDFLLIADGELPEEGELEYTQENAYTLVTNSKLFDGWLTSIMSDISLFNKGS